MGEFPRTTVGGVSVSRMIVGSNWFLGWSHTTAAKDTYIRTEIRTRERITAILETFLRAGVDTVMGFIAHDDFHAAIQEAEQRVGRKIIVVSTPGLPVTPDTPARGFDLDEVARLLDAEVARGATFCLPHQGTTDALVDRCTREIRQLAPVCALMRERGLIPGLSTHMPESVVYADESGLDVDTYIQIYNSMGFLMQIEVDWVNKIIREAKKPVMTIKPMAAGQLRPFQGLTFAWNSLRPCDMVTVGTMTPDEAQECIDLSLEILDGQPTHHALQETRSKASVKAK
jgi:hypothetical protein